LSRKRSRYRLTVEKMARATTIRVLMAVLGISVYAAAQSDPAQERTGPVPALGQTAPILNPDNPPVSSLDEAGLEMRSGSRSFVSYGLSVSETADTNAGNQPDRQGFSSVTHLLGALDFQRFYAKTDLIGEYVGGGAFYSNAVRDVSSLQALGVLGVTRWRTGRLTLRDSFSYLPEGSFSIGSFGGAPGLGIATGSGGSGLAGGGLPGSHFFGNGEFGSVGLTPRISNSAFADVVQSLSPRSAFTIATGFSNAHFFDNTNALINSDKVMVQAGYSYMVGRRDQIGAIYGFQQFRFPQDVGGQIDAQVANVRWSHTISGRMSLIASLGPQRLVVEDPFLGSVTHWSANGRAVVRYRFTRTSIAATYEKFTSAGSGFFAGADTQSARLSVTRPLARTLEVYLDFGYAHNKRLQSSTGDAGVPGNTFNHAFARVLFRKHLGREFSSFAAYRFNDTSFSSPTCDLETGDCGRSTARHMATIGLEWHPRPSRID
jgi:hypothetical protein